MAPAAWVHLLRLIAVLGQRASLGLRARGGRSAAHRLRPLHLAAPELDRGTFQIRALHSARGRRSASAARPLAIDAAHGNKLPAEAKLRTSSPSFTRLAARVTATGPSETMQRRHELCLREASTTAHCPSSVVRPTRLALTILLSTYPLSELLKLRELGDKRFETLSKQSLGIAGPNGAIHDATADRALRAAHFRASGKYAIPNKRNIWHVALAKAPAALQEAALLI